MSASDQVLPPLYARWTDELLGGPIPAETRATCLDCAMWVKEGRNPAAYDPFTGQEISFLPSTKCCTYVPSLPNFLAGGVLLDEDPAVAPGGNLP